MPYADFDEERQIFEFQAPISDDYQTQDQVRVAKQLIPQDASYKYHSYSGCDISAIVHFFDETAEEGSKSRIKKLADLQTLTFSTHREKFPVRTLGRVGAKGYTRGPRTIGGTMIFTVFDKAVLAEMLVGDYISEVGQDQIGAFGAVLIDQIPPFDITVLFANETGSISRLAIYGVELVNEGQTMSIEDLMTENVVNYVARHIQPMVSLTEVVEPYLKDGLDLPGISFTTINQNKKYAQLLSSLE